MADSPPDPHKLCLQCGLCCNGAWFTYGSLEEDEVDPGRQHGLRVEIRQDKPHFRQPCSQHLNGSCSLYARWRPRVCADYRCALLERFVRGEVTEPEALGHVAAAKAMHERIVAETGPLEDGIAGPAFRERLSTGGRAPGAAGPDLSPGAMMDAVALIVYFDRHFRKPDQPEDQAAAADPASPDRGT